MPQRYPSWVIRNIVEYLKLKLSRQFPTFSCHDEKQEYETQLTDNYPRLYIFASVAEPLGSNISCKLGPDKNIEMEVLIRDRRTNRLFIKLALKSYKDFDLVIHCMHQSICNYLKNDSYKLSCSSPYMQQWTPMWSNAQNNGEDEKYISPELYASYFERDGGYTINTDIKIHYDEKDDGSANFNNIQDPYLTIVQIPKPDDKVVPKLTDAEDKQRRTNIVNAVKDIWEKLSKEKYPGVEEPRINNLLGGILISKISPLRIIWVKYSFKKIHDHLISLGQQDSQDELERAKLSLSIHSSSAEFDATTYSRPRRTQRQLHSNPINSNPSKKKETPSKSTDPFFLYMAPTPEDAEDVKEDLSVSAIKPVNKSGSLQKELKPSAPPAPPVQLSMTLNLDESSVDELSAPTKSANAKNKSTYEERELKRKLSSTNSASFDPDTPTIPPKRLTRSSSRQLSQSPESNNDKSNDAQVVSIPTSSKAVSIDWDAPIIIPPNLTHSLSRKTSQSEMPNPLGDRDLQTLKKASDKTSTTEQKSVAFSATTKTATPQLKPIKVAAKSPAPPIKASPIIAKQTVYTAKPLAPKASPALKEFAKPAMPINDSDSLVARLAAKALSPSISKPTAAPIKPSAIKTKQTGAAQSTSTFDRAAYIPPKSVSFSNTLASVDALLADNKKRKQAAVFGSKDATVESQETLKSKPVAIGSKATALASKATLHSKAVALEPKNVALTAKDLERGNPEINLEEVTTRPANKRAALTVNDETVNKDPKRKRAAPTDAAAPESDSSARYPSRKR